LCEDCAISPKRRINLQYRNINGLIGGMELPRGLIDIEIFGTAGPIVEADRKWGAILSIMT
jgi:hypothetical protein